MESFKKWLKQEVVLVIAVLLAVISSFFVKPDRNYIGYIDWETLALLFSLMVVMGGFKSLGVFTKLGHELLKRVKTDRQVECIFILACFFTSMFITNDVALITFVPFTIEVLKMAKMREKTAMTVILETIAANLGSMATPIGNPQNIYLYIQSGYTLSDFFRIIGPFTVLSFILLLIAIFSKKANPLELSRRALRRNLLASGRVKRVRNRALFRRPDVRADQDRLMGGEVSLGDVMQSNSTALFDFYVVLFVICLLGITRTLSIMIIGFTVLLFVIVIDKNALKRVDYSLILTFVGFFIFVGNMQRIPAFSNAIESMLQGNELLTTIGISQIISNVPATLLLTGFTKNWEMLLIGSNLGGLGTLIASMASLISFKFMAKEYPDEKGKYLLRFTVWNVVFLAINLAFYYIMN